MATKSLIGRTHPDGSVEFVKVTYDGSIAATGILLHYDWQSDSDIAQLISGGNIHVLGRHIGSAHDGRAAPPVAEHVQDTVFNVRDRGGELLTEKSLTVADAADFWKFEHDADQPVGARQKWQVRYLWNGSVWLTLDPETGEPMLLADLLHGSYVVSSVRGRDDDGVSITVELLGDEQFAPHAHGTLAEFIQFMEQTTAYQVVPSRIEDPVFRFADDSALVALRLRYNIEDSEQRSLDA